MRHVSRTSLALAIATCLVALPGCGDDETIVAPQPFQVVVEITDPDGDPVPGLEMGLAPDSPWYMDGKRGGAWSESGVEGLRPPSPCPFYPTVTIAFDLEENHTARLSVEDIEDGLVRDLGQAATGPREFAWNGRDDEGAPVASGVYSARLEVRDQDTDEIVLDESRPMLLAAFLADQFKVGTTDANGRIVLRDRRLFPYLYDVPDFPAVDEDGNLMGTISLTPATRFYVSDPVSGDTMRFDGDVTGPLTLRFTWDPAP